MWYLKYRPKTIDQVDNTNVKEEVKKILQAKSLPHAFLFVGQKGTGKTSIARIVAKAVNCEKNAFGKKNNSIEPCNICGSCKNIDTSASLDVIEMDAASNRGIDEIRSLIKESSFLPMSNRYRVFIIDEAHMITHDAFNALLKTLEEPPSYVLFILATTNIEKVPKTIRSRCFILNFGRATQKDILHMLHRVSDGEKLNVDPKLLPFIAKHSDNSFRDATKLLEELVIQNKLSLDDGKKFLGIVGKDSLLEVIKKQALKEALSWAEHFSQAGGDYKNLLEQLLDELHEQLLLKNKVYTREDGEDIGFSLGEISYLIRLFYEAYNTMKYSPIESLPLEIAIVDFYNNKKRG